MTVLCLNRTNSVSSFVGKFLYILLLIAVPYDENLYIEKQATTISPSAIQTVVSSQKVQVDPLWHSKALDNIKKEEYNITYSLPKSAYQSPNRKQNLRFTYHSDGFTAEPRTTKNPLIDDNNRMLKSEGKSYRSLENWEVTLTTIGLVQGSTTRNFEGKILCVKQNTASVEDELIRIEYHNDEEGMRQNFIIKEKLSNNDKLLRVRIKATTDLTLSVSNDAVVFRNYDSQDKLKYHNLKVWDAENKSLNAYFDKEDDRSFCIIVTDENAIYPITIDPLSTSSNWTKEGNQVNAYFGWRVATAGDVNGDGYGDVIVGTYAYDNGETDEGRAFIYYGNNGTSLHSKLRQTKYSTTTIIGPQGLSGTNGCIRLGMYSKSPFGRADGRLVYECKANGQPYSTGTTITNSVSYSGRQSSFADMGGTGNSLSGMVLSSISTL